MSVGTEKNAMNKYILTSTQKDLQKAVQQASGGIKSTSVLHIWPRSCQQQPGGGGDGDGDGDGGGGVFVIFFLI